MRILCLSLVLLSSNLLAQSLEYPELNVTPRASERLKIEASREDDSAYSQFYAIQVSGLSSLVAGVMGMSETSKDAEDDGRDILPSVAAGIGLAWVGATYYMASSYRPYKAAYIKLSKMPYKSTRDRLTMERLAEEELHALKSMGRKMRWISAVSNLALAGAVMDTTEKESDAKMAAGVAAAFAIGSVFFPLHWEKVSDEQDQYKKRIFSPVALTPALFKDIKSNKNVMGMNLVMSF